ncbi:unnamed protein product [[Candida] boidinii]|nr:unnamed protein product [[Candida] boidinii]
MSGTKKMKEQLDNEEMSISSSEEANEQTVQNVNEDTGNTNGMLLKIETTNIDPESRPMCFTSTFQEYVCVLALAFAPAAASMASSAFQVSLTELSSHFDIVGGKLTWSVSSVTLANGSSLLLMGGLADAFGRRNTLLFGYFSYTLAALIGGFMKDYVALCIFRALQGMFVAASVPSAAGFLGATYKNGRRKNMVMSVFAAGAPVGGSLGLVLGAVFAQIFNWRAVHFYLAIFYGALAVLVFFVMPSDKKVNWTEAMKILKGLDYLGSFISLSGVTLICFSLTQADSLETGWHTGYIIALLVVGIFLMGCFVVYESYVPERPVMPMQMWKSKSFCLAMGVAMFSYMEFFGVLNYYAALYFEQIRNYSPIITGVCFLTQPIAGTLVNVFAGFTMHLIPGTILVIVGTAGLTAAAIIWATLSIHRNYFLGPFWSFILTVLGVDLVYNVVNRVALSSVDKTLQSRAAGTFNTVMQLSATIGLSISATIVSAKNPYYGTPEQNTHIVELFESFKYAYYFAIGCGATSLIFSCLIRVGVVGNVAPKPDKEEVVEADSEPKPQLNS